MDREDAMLTITCKTEQTGKEIAENIEKMEKQSEIRRWPPESWYQENGFLKVKGCYGCGDEGVELDWGTAVMAVGGLNVPIGFCDKCAKELSKRPNWILNGVWVDPPHFVKQGRKTMKMAMMMGREP